MKKLYNLILLLLLSIYFLNPFIINALTYPEINSKILEIYDLTDKKIITEIDSTKQASIASLTKIVTVMTAIETIPNLEEEVTITRDILNTVQWDASVAGLKIGDKLTYKDLLYAAMLPSGADATNSIAILSSGSIENYVNKMNDFVSKLNVKNTHFVNVTGLDVEGHYSTADDIRIILEYALSNELFKKIYTTKEYTLPTGLKVYSTLKKYANTIDTSKILGSKTGYTGDAGYCLSSLSNINSHEFIIITLDAKKTDTQYHHISDTINLINFLQDNYKDQILVKKDTILKTIPIKLSKQDQLEIKAKKDIIKYLPSDYDINKLKIDYQGLEELSFKNKIGSLLGTITYYYDNELIEKETIKLNTKIEISIKKIIKEYYYILILLGIIVLIIISLFLKRKKKGSKKNV